jgi:hypothetical protein
VTIKSRAADDGGNLENPGASVNVTVSPDATPPTVTGNTPSKGATGVSTATAVTATFSEAMNPTTISGSSFELRDASNAVVPATVTYNAGTNTATLTPSSVLAATATFTATVRGGTSDPRVKDVAGNALAANLTWVFTTAAGPACPCSIWPAAATPANPADTDTLAVELGVKFRSDMAGTITGIRFYKGTGNTGVHVGHLWTSTGTQLATATFTGETASGWQQVNFATPVAVTANTVYVVSYLAPNGRYAYNSAYFAAQGFDNAPLHALQNGVSGANGVYIYGATGGFPSSTYNSNNYWVDVVFDTTVGPDTTSPTVPGNLIASVISGTQISLSWTASTDNVAVTGYRVERCQGVGCSNFVEVAIPTPTSFADSGLTEGTIYRYRVLAADGAGNLSAYSAVATATTTTLPVAVADTFLYGSGSPRTVNYSGSLGLGVLANDTEPANLPLTAVAVGTLPTGVTLASNGVVTINLSTATTFRYRASNGPLLSQPTTGALVTLSADSVPAAVVDNCTYNRAGSGSITLGTACVMTGTKIFTMNLKANDTDPNTTTNVPTDGVGKTVTGAVITSTGTGVAVSNSACQTQIVKTASRATINNNCDGTLTVTVAAAAPASPITLVYRALDDLGAQSATRTDTVTVQ